MSNGVNGDLPSPAGSAALVPSPLYTSLVHLPSRDVVAVIPDRTTTPGFDGTPESEVKVADHPIAVVPWQEAFTRDWPTDAHVVPYLVEPYEAGETFYRLNKPAAARILEQGDVVVAGWIFADVDTPDHEPWTEEKWAAFLVTLQGLSPQAKARLEQAAVGYTTRRGLRFGWKLPFGVGAEEIEPFMRGLLAELHAGGLPVDLTPTLATWNCCHRLPRVTRDGAPSWVGPFYRCEIYPDRVLDLATVQPIGKVERSGGAGSSGPVPVAEDVKALRCDVTKPGQPMTPFFRFAKKQLEGQTYAKYCLDGAILEPVEGVKRHDVLCSWILSAASRVAKYAGESTTAEHLYALWIDVAEQLHMEEPDRGWLREVWRLCTSAWAKVEHEAQAKVQEDQARAVLVAQAHVDLLAAARKIYPGIPEDDRGAMDWLRPRMILKHMREDFFWLMRPDGYHHTVDVNKSGLIPFIRQTGMDKYIQLDIPTKTGMKLIEIKELLKTYCTNVREINYCCEIPGSYMEDAFSMTPKLKVLSFRRNPNLKPEFNKDVDEWLKQLFEEPGEYERWTTQHIPALLAWDEGLAAAFSFVMGHGVGKKMILRGLLETLENPLVPHATGEDICGKWNSKLLWTPFIFMNEGLPQSQEVRAMDVFRRTTTGDDQTVSIKFKENVLIRFGFRIGMFANDQDLIAHLSKDKDLTPDERAAIAQRAIFYLSKGYRAAEWLKKKGGYTFTDGWVAGDSGSPSKFIVAKHFLWLYHQYKDKLNKKGRMLIEGSLDQEAIYRMRSRGVYLPIVTEILSKILDQKAPFKADGSDGVVLTEGGSRVFMTVASILDYHRSNHRGGSVERLTAHRIEQALCSIAPLAPPLGAPPGQQWREIDVVFVSRFGGESGWSCWRIDEAMRVRATKALQEQQKNVPLTLVVPKAS